MGLCMHVCDTPGPPPPPQAHKHAGIHRPPPHMYVETLKSCYYYLFYPYYYYLSLSSHISISHQHMFCIQHVWHILVYY